MRFSAAILAGGKSTRMGSDKAFLEIGAERMIDRVTRILKEVFPKVTIVTNSPAEYAYLDVRLVRDILPGKGPLGGLHAALMFSPSEQVFVTGCDMPLLNPEVIRFMLDRADRCDVLVPEIGGYLEPLHAIYSRMCLKAVEETLSRGKRQIFAFYPRVRVKRIQQEELMTIDPALLSFRNVNTVKDLEEITRLVEEERG